MRKEHQDGFPRGLFCDIKIQIIAFEQVTAFHTFFPPILVLEAALTKIICFQVLKVHWSSCRKVDGPLLLSYVTIWLCAHYRMGARSPHHYVCCRAYRYLHHKEANCWWSVLRLTACDSPSGEEKEKKKSKLHPLVHWAGRVQKRDTPSFLLNNPCKRAWFWCSLESVMKKGLVYCQTTQQRPFTTMRSLNSTSNSNGGVSKPLASVTWASVNTDSLGADGAFVVGAHAGERLTWPIGHCCPGLSRRATLMGQLTN